MDTGLQNTQSASNIHFPHLQEQVKPKRQINYLKIFVGASLLVLLSSTTVLAYQNFKTNQIISKNGLRDYFDKSNQSITIQDLLQSQKPIPTIAPDKETLARDLQKIQDEAIRIASGSAICERTPDPTPADSTNEPVDKNELYNLISFQLPFGWSKLYSLDELKKPILSIDSPDFKYTGGLNFASGVTISITYKPVDASYTINSEDNESNRKFLQDFKFTTINGKPAAYGYLGFETYSDRYFVLNNQKKWTIFISYGGNTPQEGLNTKTKYATEIEQFLSSIVFK